LGLLLLIATPVARVIFSLIGFSIEKDLIYVAITTVVLINAHSDLQGFQNLEGLSFIIASTSRNRKHCFII